MAPIHTIHIVVLRVGAYCQVQKDQCCVHPSHTIELTRLIRMTQSYNHASKAVLYNYGYDLQNFVVRDTSYPRKRI